MIREKLGPSRKGSGCRSLGKSAEIEPCSTDSKKNVLDKP